MQKAGEKKTQEKENEKRKTEKIIPQKGTGKS